MDINSFTGPSLMEMVKDRVNCTNNYTDGDDYVTKNYKPHMDYPFKETSSASKTGYTVIKIRPKAELYHSEGNDGWDAYDGIRYRCPTCNRLIGPYYKYETACDQCGTFYDWGNGPARIVITKSVQWD